MPRANKEDDRKYGRKWYAKNRARIAKYSHKYYQTHKKQCAERVRKYRQKNRKIVNLWSRLWRKANPKKADLIRIRAWLKSRYGISLDEKKEMFRLQKNRCAICRKRLGWAEGKVDHNHKTKKVRGILCNSCNFMLGFARDDIKILRFGINYLRRTL